MIEVEKKFVFDGTSERRIIEIADFLGEETFTDIYYDTEEYSIVGNDMWFRKRDDRFELKIPARQTRDRAVDQYEEIENDEEIARKLNLPRGVALEEILVKAGISAFAVCKTVRRKYKAGDFNIVLDDGEFNDGFTRKIGEIELMVNDKSQVGEAVKKILKFAEHNGLSTTPLNGKLLEYLKQRRPAHYQAFMNMIALKQ